MTVNTNTRDLFIGQLRQAKTGATLLAVLEILTAEVEPEAITF